MDNFKISLEDNLGDLIIKSALDYLNSCLKIIKALIEDGDYYMAYYTVCSDYTKVHVLYNDIIEIYGADRANRDFGRALKTWTRLKNAMNNLINYATN